MTPSTGPEPSRGGNPCGQAGGFSASEDAAVAGGRREEEDRAPATGSVQAVARQVAAMSGGARGLHEGWRSRVATTARIRGTWGEVNGRETTRIGSDFSWPCAWKSQSEQRPDSARTDFESCSWVARGNRSAPTACASPSRTAIPIRKGPASMRSGLDASFETSPGPTCRSDGFRDSRAEAAVRKIDNLGLILESALALVNNISRRNRQTRRKFATRELSGLRRHSRGS